MFPSKPLFCPFSGYPYLACSNEVLGDVINFNNAKMMNLTGSKSAEFKWNWYWYWYWKGFGWGLRFGFRGPITGIFARESMLIFRFTVLLQNSLESNAICRDIINSFDSQMLLPMVTWVQ